MLDRLRHLADVGVRHGEDRHLGTRQRRFGGHALDAEILGKPCTARIAHLHMTHGEARVLQIAGQAVAHFAAGTEESD